MNTTPDIRCPINRETNAPGAPHRFPGFFTLTDAERNELKTSLFEEDQFPQESYISPVSTPRRECPGAPNRY